jgi:uridine kinase
VELLDMRSPYGNQCYQNSLALLYLEAVHHVFGKNVKVTIANSLSQGLFTRIHVGTITDEQIKKVSEHMQKMVKLDLTIGETRISKDEMLNYLKDNKDSEEYRLVKTAKDLHYCELVQLDDETGFSYCHLVPSTRYLKLFDVRRYRTGVLLRFPNYRKPDTVPPYEEQKQLYEAFSEETQWEQLMNVRFVADLNQKVLADDYRELIMLSEALHEKKIAEIAGMIHESRRRIILIAGPSSSGKTSFAKRLCIQLRVLGLKPLYLGTDDETLCEILYAALPSEYEAITLAERLSARLALLRRLSGDAFAESLTDASVIRRGSCVLYTVSPQNAAVVGLLS